MAADNSKNQCQYWVKEVQCVHWNLDSSVCSFESTDEYEEFKVLPDLYKTCNFLGTATNCSHFDPGENSKEYRCILPDPSRHVGNYKTSSKYAIYVSDPEGGDPVLDTSAITGYTDNGLSCEVTGPDGGTNKTCSGYSPYHIGFGKILPTKTTTKEEPKFLFRLPLNYALLNLRSTISTCYWWQGPVHIFKIEKLTEEETPNKSLNSVVTGSTLFKYPKVSTPAGCSRLDTDDYVTHAYDNYACNGSNSNCDHYTGVCWKNAINDKIESGDKVLAEQILELRYYIKEHEWTYELYNVFGFKNLKINTFVGIEDYRIGDSVDYNIIKVGLLFDQGKLAFSKVRDILTEGTEVITDDGTIGRSEATALNFPTLVQDIGMFIMSPLIINNFFQDDANNNIYETNKSTSCNILIIGNQHTYVYDTICINLSKLKDEPDFYRFIERFEDINLLYANYINVPAGEADSVFSSKFHLIQEELDKEITRIRLYDSESVSNNTLSNESKGFIFNVDTVYGKNNIVVLSKYKFNDEFIWSYSNIVVCTTFVSGFLHQNEYNITEGSSSTGANFVDRLYDYRRSLFRYDRKVRYSFISFTDKTLVYSTTNGNTYNDFKANDLIEAGVVYTGNKLQRYRNTFDYVEPEFLYPIGPSGYVLVEFEDEYNFITEIYGDIKIKDDVINSLYLEFINDSVPNVQCRMLVVKQGLADGLQSNQFIIKPVDMEDYKTICDYKVKLYVGEVLIPVRSNPDNPPPSIVGGWLLEDDPSESSMSLVSSGTVTENGTSYIIEDFNCSLIMAVGVIGISGRQISLIKIKLAIWIKLPMCPDVEMQYKWTASYQNYQNFPQCTCCGPYTRKKISGNSSRAFSAACGDHEVSPTSGIGKMWFPYVQCENFSYYLKVSNQIYGGLTTVVELYKEKDGDDRVNGSWNLRMEGPQENDYYTGFYCCSICPCSCQVTTFNVNRVGESHFSGMCRYRGEVGLGTLKYWLETGGGLPRFGNTLRPQFISYRSTDYVQYIYYNYETEKYETLWKWMPSNMSFSDVDYLNTNDQVYSEFCNTDVLPINALGTILMTNLEGKGVVETIQENRYRFDEVFEVYLEDALMAYPKALNSNNNNPVLQYKSIGSRPIQWAWRDIPIKIKRSYTPEGEDLLDVLLGFLDIYLTPYEFDMHNMEHRLTCSEGVHYVYFTAPLLDESTGEYEFGIYPTLQLDGGLVRCFSWNKVLDPIDCQEEDEVGYATLTKSPWMPQGLFDNNYVDTVEDAEGEGTVLEKTTSFGSLKRYYNRGVSFNFSDELTSRFIPVVFTNIADFSCSPPFVDNILMVGQELELDFTFLGIKKAVSKGSIVFKYGIEPQNNENGLLLKYFIHCVPAFRVVINGDTVFHSDSKVPTFFGIREKIIDFDYFIDIDYLSNRSNDFKIILELAVPLDSEGKEILPDVPYVTQDNDGRKYDISYGFYSSIGAGSLEDDSAETIGPEIVTLFDTIIVSTAERIFVTERKYKISFFAGNYIPPHGINVGERVLAGREASREYCTTWQRDKNGSVVNLPNSEGVHEYIHKTRSRFVFEAFSDVEYIHKDLQAMESVQEDLYNTPMKKDTASFSYTSTMYPGMESIFEEHNLKTINRTGSGSFSNNILYKLGTLIHYPKMQGKGFQLLPSNPWHESCRHVGGRDGCNGDDTFYYSRVNMGDGTSFTSSYDALNIFYEGTLLMSQRISIARYLVNRMSSVYAASAKGKVFVEGVPRDKAIPEFFPLPGQFDTTPEWYEPPKERPWPIALPGLWRTLGWHPA